MTHSTGLGAEQGQWLSWKVEVSPGLGVCLYTDQVPLPLPGLSFPICMLQVSVEECYGLFSRKCRAKSESKCKTVGRWWDFKKRLGH
jgi:hypothetical protein